MPVLLQFNTALNYGSTGHIAEEIGLMATAAGWDCYIVHGPRMKNSSRLRCIQANSSFDEKVHGFWYSLLGDKHGLGSSAATKKLIRQIDTIKPDVIHLHNIHGYYLNYKVLFEYLLHTKIPVVWTLHDCWPITGHCSHFDWAGCNYWQTECHDCPQLTMYPKSLFRDNTRNNYLLKRSLFTALHDRLTLVPVSNWLGTIIQNSFLSKCNMQTIYNGVNIETFRPLDAECLRIKYHLENKRIVLGVATSWTQRKGFDDYLKLRSQLSDNYVVIMIGLTQRQINLLSPGMIGITRTQDQHELARFYSMADIVLSLSCEETFGLTVVEGFACGTPAVAYGCTAIPELITSDTGLIVESGNIGQLVAAIEQITVNEKMHYATACRKRAEENFNKEDRFREYINLYNKLLNS